MDTSDFESSVATQAATAAEFGPDVVVGSSFGGAVAVALLQRAAWRGPTLLLAQAALRMGLPAELPPGVPIWLVHAGGDAIVPLSDSQALANAGDPAFVRLIEVEDDHALHAWVDSGELVEAVRELAKLG
jgi:pimeloyl-ACP methyl ester carboxylesterase